MMEGFSIFTALRAAFSTDFLIGLVNNDAQRTYPFPALIGLCTVFVAVSALFFTAGPNGLLAGVTVSFFVACASVLLSLAVLIGFRSSRLTSVQKLSYVFLATFTSAVFLFDLNLLLPGEIDYLGSSLPLWIAGLLYCSPYAIYVLLRSLVTMRGRWRLARGHWV